uniref:Uncharacterized protein n=1 Tax=Rhizophagus irregularis (strain DAOM 181602 / DAOM 197198 / MUCL 43194) TaxID=747089 RepID=U9TAZ5_RHIID
MLGEQKLFVIWAESLNHTCDYQLALQFSKKALSLENDNLKVLEILGMIEIELEMFDEAREVC